MNINVNQAILELLHTKKKITKEEILASDDKKLLDLVSKTL
jgi:hypothetical protein